MRPAILLLALIFPVTVSAGDWPQWLGPQRNGAVDATIAPWTAALEVLWRQPVGEGHSSPIVADGKVFLHHRTVGKDEEVVTAWDTSGKQLWQSSYARAPYTNMFGNGPRATPAWAEGKLYTFGVTGLLSCWDSSSGKEVWQQNLLEKFDAKNLYFGTSTSPMISGKTLFTMPGGKDGSVVALNAADGKVLWKSGADAASYASPMMTKVGEKELVVFLTAQGVVGIDAGSGKEYWKVPLKDLLNESSTTPVRVGDMLFASSVTTGSIGIQLDGSGQMPSAKQVWKNPKISCYFGTPVEFDGLLYAVTGRVVNPTAVLNCIDPKTGEVRWSKPGVGTYHASLLRTKDKLLMLEEKGDLVMLQPGGEKYEEVCRAKLCGTTWAHAAWADGVVYIRDAKELVAVRLR